LEYHDFVRQKFLFAFVLVLILLPFLCTGNQTQPAVPAVTPEQTEKAVSVLFQVVRNVEAYVNSKELSSVHNEDMMLYGALSMLLLKAKESPTEEQNTQFQKLMAFGRQVADLHEASDAGNQPQAETRLKIVTDSFQDLKKFYGQDLLSRAEILSNQYTCPMHPDVIGKSSDLCPKCGMPLDQIVRINLYGSGQTLVPPTTMKGSIQTFGPLTVGVENNFLLRLRRTIDSAPILMTDLREVHTQKIHLFIIDSSLTDYHHIHPTPSETAGSYSFAFTPLKPGPYKAWADLRSTATGFQEYVMTEIPAQTPGEPLQDKSIKLDAKAEGLNFRLTFASKELKVGEPVLGKLRITQNNGKPFTKLEPVMGMFAHIAGFNEDGKTVLHMHPQGGKVLKETDRGGPELPFVFYATKPGFYRLFAQIQVDGISRFAPFGITVY
jgi:hypothetical protein